MYAHICVCMCVQAKFDLTCDIEYVNSLDVENPVAFTGITDALCSNL